ncbi:membrane dipeptidase [Acinetobacter sp. B10A]|uniref:dipeptidase n=1 Tax=Acinetobacter baretiae TaxID=2605383 RepID=UPI001B3C52B3|nr:membrane dipeptidase [Acinetobacter baretiae]MBF7685212.1 membrane dipeptidase [Acinetobacter baretiae]
MIFDGHNDLLARLWMSSHRDPVDQFLHHTLEGQMDLRRCRQGRMYGGLFAIFVPPLKYVKTHASHKLTSMAHSQADFTIAQRHDICTAQMDYALEIEYRSQGAVKICRDMADIHLCMKNQCLAMVLHLEGAEALTNVSQLDDWYAKGLRSVGLLWNEPSQFGHGLQGKFPHSPDTGLGLTDLGQQWVVECEKRRMLVDVSHMNEQAFWHTQQLLTQPIVATHSNIHKLCPQARNLLDSQLNAIKVSHGVVGLNFDTAFLRADGQRNIQTPYSVMFAHFDYLFEYLGETGVAFGSDYDGGFMSKYWPSVDYFPRLIDALSDYGYSDTRIENICHKNWYTVLHRIWASLNK